MILCDAYYRLFDCLFSFAFMNVVILVSNKSCFLLFTYGCSHTLFKFNKMNSLKHLFFYLRIGLWTKHLRIFLKAKLFYNIYIPFDFKLGMMIPDTLWKNKMRCNSTILTSILHMLILTFLHEIIALLSWILEWWF